VIVLMTDGSNTQQYDLLEPYKSGLSYIWFHRSNPTQPLHEVPFNKTSIQYDGYDTPDNYWDDRFYWNDAYYYDRWQKFPNGFSNQTQYVAQREAAEGVILAAGSGQSYIDHAHRAS